MDAETINEIREQFFSYRSMLNKTYKAVEIKEQSKHASGQTVETTATIKVSYDLTNGYGRVRTAIIPSCDYTAIDVDWLRLCDQSREHNMYLSLEDFLALPDWDDSLQSISSKII